MAKAPNTTALIPMSEGVKILYKGAIDNVIFLKRQQWIITNYSLVVYAAVVGLSKAANDVERTLLTVVAGLAFAYAVSCMIHTQMSLTKLRTTIDIIWKTYFTSGEAEKYKFWKTTPTFFYTPLFIIGLVFANAVAFAATVYLVWRVTPLGAIA